MIKTILYYSSLDDLPIFNWRMINEKNDLEFLLKKKKKLTEKEQEKLKEVFEIIYDSFIDAWGISDQYRRILELKRDIAVLQARMFLEKDRSIKTEIRIADHELNMLLNKNENGKQSFSEVKAYVDKFMGFRINAHETSVNEYYGYLELMKKQNNG